MSRGWITAVLLLVGLVCANPAAGEGMESVPSGGDDGGSLIWSASEKSWGVTAEALFLSRDNHSVRQPIAQDATTFDTILSTRDLHFDPQAGPRLTARIPTGEDSNWEISYFGMIEWHTQAVAQQTDNLSLPGWLGNHSPSDYSQATRMTLGYDSELHNVEVNRSVAYGPVSFLGGFRYVHLGETFNINSYDEADTGTSDYHIRTRNELYGGQIGAQWRYARGKLGLEMVTKAGLFGNTASSHTQLRDLDDTLTLRDDRFRQSRFAFVGEFGIGSTWQITNWLALRSGYNVMWIQGVALAPDQLDYSDPSVGDMAWNTSGSVLLHGANLGIEARW